MIECKIKTENCKVFDCELKPETLVKLITKYKVTVLVNHKLAVVRDNTVKIK